MSDYRHMVWTVVGAVPPLVTELDPECIYGNGVLKDVPKRRPFIILKLGERTEMMANAKAHSHTFRIHVHDDPGSFTTIDKILRAFKSLMVPEGDEGMYQWPRLNPETTLPWDPTFDAQRAIGVRYAGESSDLADDYYGTLMRYSAWQCIGKGP